MSSTRFISFIVERWEVNDDLEFVKEDIIKGLENDYYPPSVLL